MHPRLLRLTWLVFGFTGAAVFAASTPPVKPQAAPAASAATLPVPKPRTVVTHHQVTIGGRRIAYTATAGTLLLYDAKHHPTASVFYIAYTRDGVDAARRPITFAYNGGPGFASALVDVGGFGPRRIDWPAPGQTDAMQPPYRLVDNPDSLLARTDLVFIDAIGTGYSRLAGRGTPKMFYGIDGDAHAFSQFIQRYVTQNQRWNSPKFLLGESYGTTRSAVLAQDLVKSGMYLNGVIMCSTVLDFATINFTAGNDLPYALYLPSYAAVAWYHHRLPPGESLSDAVAAARAYASSGYLRALFAGAALSPADRSRVAVRLAAITGIPATPWERADLRMTLPVFMRRLLGPNGPMTGRFDARFTTHEMQPQLPIPGRSNAGAATIAIWGALTASFDGYLRNELNYRSSHLYSQSSAPVFKAWNWTYRSPLNGLGSGVGNLKSRNVAPALARAMTNDPGMRVLFNNGYYDMATPFFATEYTIQHMGLDSRQLARISEAYYPVGHMLYLNPKVEPQLARTIDDFIAAAAPKAKH
ncbi:MAG: peptidase S10 [Steroidobacteraceae bacterium]|nr:peptidase S10 [Steroidobacteraceae bacterium]